MLRKRLYPLEVSKISKLASDIKTFGAQRVLASSWASSLSTELRKRVEEETITKRIDKGRYVCRKGEKATEWFCVVEGLIKVSIESSEGKEVSFIGVPSGGWFGEGALLKNESRLYDAIALRPSIVAFVPRSTFFLLLETSVTFNRFLLLQLNERLGQFVGMVKHGRLLAPEARLATELAALFNPVLYPGHRESIPISQEELSHLVGLSRQRVNSALKKLATAGLLRVHYRSITIVDLDRLRAFDQQ